MFGNNEYTQSVNFYNQLNLKACYEALNETHSEFTIKAIKWVIGCKEQKEADKRVNQAIQSHRVTFKSKSPYNFNLDRNVTKADYDWYYHEMRYRKHLSETAPLFRSSVAVRHVFNVTKNLLSLRDTRPTLYNHLLKLSASRKETK